MKWKSGNRWREKRGCIRRNNSITATGATEEGWRCVQQCAEPSWLVKKVSKARMIQPDGRAQLELCWTLQKPRNDSKISAKKITYKQNGLWSRLTMSGLSVCLQEVGTLYMYILEIKA